MGLGISEKLNYNKVFQIEEKVKKSQKLLTSRRRTIKL